MCYRLLTISYSFIVTFLYFLSKPKIISITCGVTALSTDSATETTTEAFSCLQKVPLIQKLVIRFSLTTTELVKGFW